MDNLARRQKTRLVCRFQVVTLNTHLAALLYMPPALTFSRVLRAAREVQREGCETN